MSPETFIAFALFALVGSITPGPNNVMLTATGAAVGIKRGMPALLGVTLGFSVMVSLVALGLGSFITANPSVLNGLRIAGILMLVWMAWKIATAPVATSNLEAPAPIPQKPIGFLGAAAFQWVNPKAWLVAVSAAATYFVADQAAVSQAVFFGMIFLMAAIPSCFLWLSFGAAAGRVLAHRPRLAQGFNILMAALLLSSIWLMIA